MKGKWLTTENRLIIALVLIVLCNAPLNAKTLFKCTQPNGQQVFSDQPCSLEYTQIKLHAGLVSEQRQPEEKNKKFTRKANAAKHMIIGRWERNGFIYNLTANGLISAEKYDNDKITAWRSGTWFLEHSKLSINFTKYSSASFKYRDRDESLITGIIKWGTGNNTFSIRSNGALKYFKRLDQVPQQDLASLSVPMN